jgi:hypothetical protein
MLMNADLLEGISEWANYNDEVVPGNNYGVNTTPFNLAHRPFRSGYVACLKFGEGSLKIGRNDQ